jgi:tetratricopeptide (TPR) repeat protein
VTNLLVFSIKFNRTVSTKPLNNKASALSSLQRDNEALECFNKVIEIDPDNFFAWSNKASILFSLDKMDKALECCNKALEINTTEPLAWITKITVLINLATLV